MEGIPLQLLIFLAEHPCQVVTRDEIAERAVGQEVFVDAATGINTAIRKVRGHSATIPRSPGICRQWWAGDTDLWLRVSETSERRSSC